MGSMNKEIFVCVDCESTGLDPKSDRIIEIAAVRFTLDELLDSYETLVNPGRPIPADSQAIHNISDEMVADQPAVKSVLPQLLEFMGTHIIVGHGITYDIDLIAAEADRYGVTHSLQKARSIDTLRLARLYGNSPSNSLGALGKHFNVHTEGAHRAMNDVTMNIDVFRHLVKPYRSTKDVFEILKKPIALKRMPLGKHKGRPFREVPEPYLKWCLHRDFDQDLMFSIRSELKRRRKGPDFQRSSNPFADL